MSQIRSKDTKPEELVRKYLFSRGFRCRKNDRRLPGTPDIVLPKYKTVIFVNGGFRHGHQGCKYFWEHYEAELQKSGDLLYTWQYDIRWSATELRKNGVMLDAKESPKGIWQLKLTKL